MTVPGNVDVDGDLVDLVAVVDPVDERSLQRDCCLEPSIVARGPALLNVRLDTIAFCSFDDVRVCVIVIVSGGIAVATVADIATVVAMVWTTPLLFLAAAAVIVK
jgi:hypothetical protein